jgi:uncharacterized membrane protein
LRVLAWTHLDSLNAETKMPYDFPKSTASIGGHPIHPMLIPFPIAFLVGAFLTDLAYLKSGWHMWAYASGWLIGAGIVFALVAALFGFIDYFGERRIRRLKVANAHMIANLLAVVLSIVNFVVHMRDGARAIEGLGVTLSGIVVLLLLFSGWMGGHMVYRHGVAMQPIESDSGRED